MSGLYLSYPRVLTRIIHGAADADACGVCGACGAGRFTFHGEGHLDIPCVQADFVKEYVWAVLLP